MWAALSKEASVCFRCQLVARHRLRTRSLLYRPQTNASRHSSTALAGRSREVEDEDAHTQVSRDRQGRNWPAQPKTLRGQDGDKGPASHPPQDLFSLRRSRESGKLSRKWKPTSVAALGVAALGQPAEVIVLEDRERLILPETEDPVPDVKISASHMQESMTSQNVEEVIRSMVSPFLNSSTDYSPEEHAALSSDLLNAFTRPQLLLYYQKLPAKSSADGPTLGSTGGQPSDTAGDGKQFKKTKKPAFRAMAVNDSKAVLVGRILKYHLGSIVKTGLIGRKMDLVATFHKDLLDDIAKQFSVVIETHRGEHPLVFRGSSSQRSAAKALSMIEKLVAEVKVEEVRTRCLGKSLKAIATPALLEQISQAHRVSFEWAGKTKSFKADHHLRMYSLPSSGPGAALRRVLLAERSASAPKVPTLMFLPKTPRKPDLVPHLNVNDVQDFGEALAWHRWACPLLHDRDSGRSDGTPLQSIPKKWRVPRVLNFSRDTAQFLEQAGLHDVAQVALTADQEVSICFGKILFRGESVSTKDRLSIASHTGEPLLNIRSSGPVTLTAMLPGLPRFLADRPPLERLASQQDSPSRRLRYFHLPASPDEPTLPVLDIDFDQKKYGNMFRVRAVIGELAENLLLPATTVDLQVKTELLIPLERIPAENDSDQDEWNARLQQQLPKEETKNTPLFLSLPRHSTLFSFAQKTPKPGPMKARKSTSQPLEAKYVLEQSNSFQSIPYKHGQLVFDHLEHLGEIRSSSPMLQLSAKLDSGRTKESLREMTQSALKMVASLDDQQEFSVDSSVRHSSLRTRGNEEVPFSAWLDPDRVDAR